MTKKLLQTNHYHFIGIGGIGMSGIAYALISRGFSVSGSDLIENTETIKLKKLGATIFRSQDKKNIDTLLKIINKRRIEIIVSSAIKSENEELIYCLKNNFYINHRSDILSLIMQSYLSIGIAGTHGKTSTATFLTTLLDSCTNNSSSIIGGIHPLYNSNSNIKESKYLVTEIDESDGTTKNYKSDLGVINNIELDHCDYYKSLNELILNFNQFALNSKRLLTNYDCKIIQNNIKSEFIWSINNIENINFSMIPKQKNDTFTIADYYENEVYIDTLNIPIPGLHNLSNITAAIAACRLENICFKDIKKNIKLLKLPKRRFEYRGSISERGIFDDYAHHPSEIKATIELGRLFIDNKNNKYKRLVVIFQPHRYSRTYEFSNQFAKELAKADLIIITNIYSAGEINKNNINSKLIGDKILSMNKNISYLKNNYEIKETFFKFTKANDLILNMGAGDCYKLWPILNNKE